MGNLESWTYMHTYVPTSPVFCVLHVSRLFVLQFNSTLASPVVVRFPTAHSPLSSQLFSKIVRADYPPIDNTLYNEHFGNLVAHLLIPDPNLRPKITVVSGCARCRFFFFSLCRPCFPPVILCCCMHGCLACVGKVRAKVDSFC